MFPKIIKFVIYSILAGVIGFIGYIIIGISFFAYKEKTLTTGCEGEFCIGQTKSRVESSFEGKFSFDGGAMVTYDPSIKPNKLYTNNIANSLEEYVETDRWTIVYDPKKGWTKFVHLSFENNVIREIKIVNYGPFYIDP